MDRPDDDLRLQLDSTYEPSDAAKVLARIVQQLDRQIWGPDATSTVAQILREAGYDVRDVDAADVCSDCGNVAGPAGHKPTCRYHERCPFCADTAAECIGETAAGVPIRHCCECGMTWEHRPDAVQS